MDIGKRLLDFGYHAPTVYFPLVVPEALMIEPTETESKETLDAFADALIRIHGEDAEFLQQAPHTLGLSRPDEVRGGQGADPALEAGMNVVRLLPFAAADGPHNMAADEVLLEAAVAGRRLAALLRLVGGRRSVSAIFSRTPSANPTRAWPAFPGSAGRPAARRWSTTTN